MKKNKEVDYSQGWRHYDVTPRSKNEDTQLGDLVYSVSGNNFGDQIIHYRRFEIVKTDELGREWKAFVTYHTEQNQEGSWIPEKFIKETARRMAKQKAS